MTTYVILNMVVVAVCVHYKEVRRDAQEGFYGSVESALQLLHRVFISDAREKPKMKRLDAGFWRELSVLRYVGALDVHGRIGVKTGEKGEKGEKGERDEKEEKDEKENFKQGGEVHMGDISTDVSHGDGKRRFLKHWRAAHMEFAAELSRGSAVSSRSSLPSFHGSGHNSLGSVSLRSSGRLSGSSDTGAGVGDFDEQRLWVDMPAGDQAGSHEDQATETSRPIRTSVVQRLSSVAEFVKGEHHERRVGIVEDPQLENSVSRVAHRLERQLAESSTVVEEVWLDAVITVLEECGCLEKLQHMFLPPPAPAPKNPKQWKALKHRKLKMERRLEEFFQLIILETRAKLYCQLQEMAVSKEQVMRQQSLVLTDYLETLDSQISKLQEEKHELDRSTMQLRSSMADTALGQGAAASRSPSASTGVAA